MQTSFGGWLSNRRIPRIALIAALLPLGLVGILSAAVTVTVAVIKGWREAAVDCLIALCILSVLLVAVGSGSFQFIVSAAATWIIAVSLGGLTGIFVSLTLSLQIAIVLAVLGLFVFAIMVSDTAAYWEGFLTDFLVQMADFGVRVADTEALMSLAPVMSGMVAASVLTSSIVALLLGSWWASNAGGPGFKAMFLQIRLGYFIGALAAVSGLAAVFGVSPLAANLLLVLGIGFVFQGLAVMHWQVAKRGWPWAFLLLVYLPFCMGALFAVMALFLLATVGFVDNWYGLRRTNAQVP